MSLTAVYGDTGSGKGYTNFELILEAVKANIPIVSNIKPSALFWEKYPNADYEYIEPVTFEVSGKQVDRSVFDFSNSKNGAYYVIQELHKVYDKQTMTQPFAAGVYVNKIPSHVNLFFSERRHFLDVESGRSIQIAIDTQHPALIAKWVKLHIEAAIYCQKHLELGTTGLFSRYTYSNSSAKGEVVNKKDLASKKLFIPYKKSVYSLYESISRANGEIIKVNDARVSNHNSLFKSKMFWFTLAAFIYLIYLFVTEPLVPISAEQIKKPEPVQTSKPVSKPASVPALVDAVKVLSPPVPAVVAPVVPVALDYSKLKTIKAGGGFIVDNFPTAAKFFGVVVRDKKEYLVAKFDGAMLYLPTNK